MQRWTAGAVFLKGIAKPGPTGKISAPVSGTPSRPSSLAPPRRSRTLCGHQPVGRPPDALFRGSHLGDSRRRRDPVWVWVPRGEKPFASFNDGASKPTFANTPFVKTRSAETAFPEADGASARITPVYLRADREIEETKRPPSMNFAAMDCLRRPVQGTSNARTNEQDSRSAAGTAATCR